MQRYLLLIPVLFVHSALAQKPPKKAKAPLRPCKIVMPVYQPTPHAYALVIQEDGTYRKYDNAAVPELKEMSECPDAPTTPGQRSSNVSSNVGGKIIP